MAHFNPVDISKTSDYKYLGWGVDCRKSETKWLDDLECYDGPQIRDICVGNGKQKVNVTEIPMDKTFKVDKSRVRSLGGNVGAGGTIKCITGEFSIGGEVTDAQQNLTEYKIIGTATLQDDISNDAELFHVNYDGRDIWHSKFEDVLSTYILEYIDDEQKKVKDATKCPGKQVRELQGENAIAKLRDFTQENKPELWQLVSNACAMIVDKKLPYTHYVYSIMKGRKKTVEKKEEGRQVNANVEGKVDIPIKPGGSAHADVKYQDKEKEINKEEMGKEQPEVIEMKLKSLHTLVHDKSSELKLIMETLLKNFEDIAEGELSGPYTISCQSKRREKIYWRVLHKKVNGTTDATKASKFYIKSLQKDSPQFSIIYRNHSGVKFFVTFEERPNDLHRLQLVQTAKTPDLSFQLENPVQEAAGLPKDPAGMAKKGPFFIKKVGGEGIAYVGKLIGYIKTPYIGMVECQGNEYKAVGREKIEEEKAGLMLFTINYQDYNPIKSSTPSDSTSMSTCEDLELNAEKTLEPLHPEYPTAGVLDMVVAGLQMGAEFALFGPLHFIARLLRRKRRETPFLRLVGSNEYIFPITVTSIMLTERHNNI